MPTSCFHRFKRLRYVSVLPLDDHPHILDPESQATTEFFHSSMKYPSSSSSGLLSRLAWC